MSVLHVYIRFFLDCLSKLVFFFLPNRTGFPRGQKKGHFTLEAITSSFSIRVILTRAMLTSFLVFQAVFSTGRTLEGCQRRRTGLFVMSLNWDLNGAPERVLIRHGGPFPIK